MSSVEFMKRVNNLYRFSALLGHLGWDQKTFMPAKGAESRGEMMAWLAAEGHSRLCDPEFGNLLSELEANDMDNDLASNVKEMRRQYNQAVKLPSDFVSQFTRARSDALIAWEQARAKSDFSLFSSHLKTLISLTRQKIEYLGVQDTPYDVLLDDYEMGMTVADYDPLFVGLKSRLVPLLQEITNSEVKFPKLPKEMLFSADEQEEFCLRVSRNMGFDFEAGRMDQSTHPFCAGIWPGDTRITTRFDEKDPFSCLYAVMHESGHGLYEQGLPKEHSFSPRGQSVSLGIHESQSRLWENQIGRTTAFWRIALPWFKEEFPDFPDWDAKTVDLLVNEVKPDYIRVEADEVTYNLHIMLRYEMEKLIFNQELSVEKIPETWNQMFEDWFGIEVDKDSNGCLQDIHWSMGAFGYFPTYTLGNLYAAQLLETMSKQLGDIDTLIESGNWSGIQVWLRENIHQKGSQSSATELIEEITGAAPSPEPFLNYVENKYRRLYKL